MNQPDERTQQYVDAVLGAILQHPQIREIRAGGYFDPYVLVYDAGLNPDEPEYDEAIAYILRLRMIEYAEETANVVGNPLYKLTPEAREAMDELDKRDEA